MITFINAKKANIKTIAFAVLLVFATIIILASASESELNETDVQSTVESVTVVPESVSTDITLDLARTEEDITTKNTTIEIIDEITNEITEQNISDKVIIEENATEEISENKITEEINQTIKKELKIVTVQNKNNEQIGSYKIFEENETYSIEITDELNGSARNGALTSAQANTRLIIKGAKAEKISAKIDGANNDENNNIKTKVIAVEPIEIEDALIQLPKSGYVNAVLVCNDNNFDFEKFECKNWEQTDIAFKDYGAYIEFTVDHFSAYAGAEIKAINAVHLDANKSFISNIFDKVQFRDDVFAEPVYSGEFVRVTYEKELNNGNFIDVYARSNLTTAYFEVYETETGNFVGRSGAIKYPEWQYIQVENLSKPSDTFDFKVVKVYASRLDDSTDLDANVNSFLEFDYIHDDFINSTQADGLIVYGEANIQTPRYRTWNESNNFTAESSASSIGADIVWTVTKACRVRDEMILGTLDTTNDINLQVFNSTKQWGNLLEIANNIPNSAYRAFDIAYEYYSGDALIVYENSTVVDSLVRYRLWNGTSFSEEGTITTGLAAATIDWIKLVQQKKSDNIMLVMHDSASSLHAIPWNGTSFDTAKNITLSTATSGSKKYHFDFAWESSGQGLVAYSSGNNLVYRTYSPTAPYWSTEATIALGDPLDTTRMCADPTSDYIGIIVQDRGNDVNVRMWDGTQILASPPTQDGTTETSGIYNVNVDCAWFNSTTALFGFIDVSTGSNGLLSMDYFNFTKTNTWSVSDLTTAPTTATFATDDIDGLRFRKNPVTSEIMITALDIAEDISLIRWTGSAFQIVAESPIENNYGTGTVINGDMESAMFAWYEYDPVPNVTIKSPSGTPSYTISTSVLINATVTDNINVSAVLANITAPNSSIFQLTLIEQHTSFSYNASFIHTLTPGTYTVRIIANDTNNNVNSTETTTFTVGDALKPNVTWLLPINNTIYNLSNIIEISANVTDDTAIGTVYANITYPNTSIFQITLSNGTGYASKYNYSFTPPKLLGNYNVSFWANDTSGNINWTERTNFTVQDRGIPNVTGLLPITNTTYYIQNTVEISANVTDDYIVQTVYINVSYPNYSMFTFTLSNSTGYPNKFNYSFIPPNKTGNYNITFWANDTSNNINWTEKTNFTIADNTAPNVTILLPLAGSSYSKNALVIIQVNATDDTTISNVTVNITKPDASVIVFPLQYYADTKAYNSTFATTDIVGTYTIRAIVNDSSNNYNNTETRQFVVADTGTPLTNLLSPADNYRSNSSTINFTCNASDDTGLSNITLYYNVTGTWHANETKGVNNTANQTNFTRYNVADGIYMWNCLAADESNNMAFAATNYTLYVDTTKPNVTTILPALNSVYSPGSTIPINATVKDNFAVSIVYANISLPDGTYFQLNLTDIDADNVYNATYSSPYLIGKYNVSIFANDTTANINLSEFTNFTLSDTDSLRITIIGCIPQNINLTNNITCNASISDDVGISRVVANVTLPDGTIQQQTVSNVSSEYHFNFTNAAVAGAHTITWWVNDTSNNIKTNTSSFNVSDIIAPTLTLNSPDNNTNTSNATIYFKFTATDNYYSYLNCSLFINGTLNSTNTAVQSGTETTFTSSVLTTSHYNWSIRCNDSYGNTNTSEQRKLTIDRDSPTFVSLTTRPNTTDELDPNLNVTVFASLTDGLTIDTVYLQYKLSNDTSYANNITMHYNSGDGLYNTSFNATTAGTYNLRLWANDTLNNYNNSNSIDIIVQNENTWTRTPSDFGVFDANANANVTLGNLTINNTGDTSLSFTISSDSSNTTYNSSSSFALGTGEATVIQVNDTAPASGTKNIILTIDAINSTADPTSLTTTATIVVGKGQPVITNTFTTPSTDTYTVRQGEQITLAADIKNIGSGNATNISTTIEIPSGWTITLGNANKNISEFYSGDTDSISLIATVPSNFAVGDYIVKVNSTGLNASGYNLTALGLIFGDKITVTVSEAQTTLGTLTITGSGGTSGTTSSVSGGGGKVAKVGGETIYTTDTLTVVRGTEESSKAKITNLYENAYMEVKSMEVLGYMSQYVKLVPVFDPDKRVYKETFSFMTDASKGEQRFLLNGNEIHSLKVNQIKDGKVDLVIQSDPANVSLLVNQTKEVDLNNDNVTDIVVYLKNIKGNFADLRVFRLGTPDPNRIYFMEEREYMLDFFAPTYMTMDEFNLTVKIDANIVALNPLLAGFTTKTITEYRNMIFKIREVSQEKANFSLDDARKNVQDMIDENIPYSKANEMLALAENEFEQGNYESVVKIIDKIAIIKKDAFDAAGLIKEVKKGIEDAKLKWLDAPEAEKTVALAEKAFEREDFETAMQRAKDAQLLLVLETKGRINILWFISEYWWAVILGTISILLISFITYKKSIIYIITQRIRNLEKERTAIHGLIKETQHKYIVEKSISAGDYHKAMAEYETRLNKIDQIDIRLRNKRVGILKTERELKNIEKEEKEVIGLMKKAQKDYFQKGELTRKKFFDIYESDKRRYAEIEEEKELLKEKLERRKLNRNYRIFSIIAHAAENLVKITKIKPKNKIKETKKTSIFDEFMQTIVKTENDVYEKYKAERKKLKEIKQKKEDEEKMKRIHNKKLAEQKKMREKEAKLRQREAERQEKLRAKNLKEARERARKYKEEAMIEEAKRIKLREQKLAEQKKLRIKAAEERRKEEERIQKARERKAALKRIKSRIRYNTVGIVERGINGIRLRATENKLRKLRLKEAASIKKEEERKIKLKEQRLAEQRKTREEKKKLAEITEKRELRARKFRSAVNYLKSLPIKIKQDREKKKALRLNERLKAQAEALRTKTLEEKRNNVRDKLSLLNKVKKPGLLQIRITKSKSAEEKPKIIFGRKIKERKEGIIERIEEKAAEKIERIEEKIEEKIAEQKAAIKEEIAEEFAERKEEEKITEQKAAEKNELEEKKAKEAENAEKQVKEQSEKKSKDNVSWLSRLWRTKKRDEKKEEKIESELAELMPFKEELLTNVPERKEIKIEEREGNETIKNLTNFSGKTETAERKTAFRYERKETEKVTDKKAEASKIISEDIPNILFALEKEIATAPQQRAPLKASEMFKRRIPQAYDPFKKKLTVLKEAEAKLKEAEAKLKEAEAKPAKKENVVSNVVYPMNNRLPQRRILIQDAEVKRKREELYQRLREELGINAKEL